MKIFSLLLAGALSTTALAKEITAGFTQENVKVQDVTLNVYKGGHGEPLLLIHGYAESALMWTPVMKALQDQFTVIVPDLRGAGLSGVTSGGYDKATMAGDL